MIKGRGRLKNFRGKVVKGGRRKGENLRVAKRVHEVERRSVID